MYYTKVTNVFLTNKQEHHSHNIYKNISVAELKKMIEYFTEEFAVILYYNTKLHKLGQSCL
jgi:hypothetical protein